MKKHTLLLIAFLAIANLIYAQTEKEVSKVYVLGTTHSNHLVSDFAYTLKDVENVIETIKPDLICIEMTAEALGSDYEGYFPPENSVIIELAKQHGIKLCPVDWRYNLKEEHKTKALSAEAKKRIQATRGKVDQLAIGYLTQNNWENYFDFIQNNKDFQQAIKEQHDTKIELLGEESDGYWISRNNKIVENLKKAIEENQAKTVLVSIGLHHKYILEELLAANAKVKEMPSYETSENSKVSDAVIKRWQRNLDKLNEMLNDEEVSEVFKNKIKQSHRIKELNDFISSEGVAKIEIRHMFEGKK